MASLYPGYFNHLRLIVFLLPPVIIITIGMCYLSFNGHLTPLYSLNEIRKHIGETDIRHVFGYFCVKFLTKFIQSTENIRNFVLGNYMALFH